ISALALLFAALIAIPFGLWLGHLGRGEFIASATANVGRAVPALGVAAFLFAYIGPSKSNVVITLALLAIPPLFTNTYIGVRQVDPEIVDAARGMGFSPMSILLRLELPLALPLLFGGLRTAAVSVVATATIAPLVGVDSLGTPIIARGVYGPPGQIGAAIAVAVLAILCEIVFAGLQRAVTPKGLKLAGDTRHKRRGMILTPTRKVQAP
ncbi:MAG: ABC transporter permease subunit, partial [Solirubrobacterales bacterium]|nr:ABC transporter permease subunit [Solirubrobacterales bacterium]